MFKLAFLFVVLMVVIVTSNPHPRQNHSKKVSASTKKHSIVHHGSESHHGKPSAKRVARSHGNGGGAHAPLHHPQSKAIHHSKKFVGKRTARNIHGGNHGHEHGHHSDKKATLVHPVKKNRGHRK